MPMGMIGGSTAVPYQGERQPYGKDVHLVHCHSTDPNAQSAGGAPEDKARLVCVRSRKPAPVRQHEGEKCGRRNLVIFQVEPKEAWRTVVRNRWKSICPLCFDAEGKLRACAITRSP